MGNDESKSGKGYEIRIGNDILLDNKAVKSVNFKIDTVDENIKDRSENVVNVVVIKGNIIPETKDVTRELMMWALARERGEVYREVEIVIRVNENSLLRKYKMSKVFCIDYTENFDAENSNETKFELKIAQRKDDFKGITVIS